MAAAHQYTPLADRALILAGVLDMDDEALRGISIQDLLANRAALFADAGQAARDDPKGTFALSNPADSLSLFVSHSWRTSRIYKWMAFCVHFNLERAVVATAIALFFAFTVQLFLLDRFPSWMVVDQPHFADSTYCRSGMLCQVSAPLVFFLFLTLGHRFETEKSVFLDIACISQDDQRLKEKGIASLGAILDRSERMLVLCDGSYFTRLWCLFEISAFAKRAGLERIDLIPLHVPLRIFGWSACFSLFSLALTMVMWPVVGPYLRERLFSNYLYIPVYTTLWLIPGLPAIVAAEVGAIEIRSALAGLNHFRLADASCFSDDDRQAILSLIGKWWSDTLSGETDPERLRQLGFHRFERFVRHSLAPQLSGKAAREWTPVNLMAVYIPFSLCLILDLLSSTNATPHHVSACACLAAFCCGVWLPMIFQAAKTISSIVGFGRRSGWRTLTLYATALLASSAAVVFMALVLCCVPFPNVVLEPEWRWPRGDEGSGALDEFGMKVYRFQVVLGAYSVAAGTYYCRA